MRRLARFLGIRRRALWPDWSAAASFRRCASAPTSSRRRALRRVAEQHGLLQERARGAWRDVLTRESRALRAGRDERLGPRLKAWLEGGRAAGGDPKEA
jgi:hypothetical protein